MTTGCGSRSATTDVTVPDQPGQALPAPAAQPALPPSTAPALAASVSTSDDRSAECALVPAAGEPVTSVGLSDRVDLANALHPSNQSEHLLFRQLYETLVRIDCMGRVTPGVATSWRLDADRRTWILTLRDNARFSNGSPVMASDVRASWMADGAGGVLRPAVNRLVDTVVPLAERIVAVTMRRQQTDAPVSLAHPDTVVARSVAGSRWPIGTRSAPVESANRIPANAVAPLALVRDDLPPIRFFVNPGDPRDLLDNREVDLLLTRDPATLRYAASLPQFQSVPLGWQRTLVLLTPGRSSTSPPLEERERGTLAADAVRGEARGAAGPFWWDRARECDAPRPPLPSTQATPIPRIVYDAEDSAARDLAERLVGLARTPGGATARLLDVLLPDRPRRRYERATGLTGEALAVALRRGSDAGYIVSVDSRPLDPCRDLLELTEGAPWLNPDAFVPLADTRLHAVVRRGRSGITVDGDGVLDFAGGSGLR